MGETIIQLLLLLIFSLFLSKNSSLFLIRKGTPRHEFNKPWFEIWPSILSKRVHSCLVDEWLLNESFQMVLTAFKMVWTVLDLWYRRRPTSFYLWDHWFLKCLLCHLTYAFSKIQSDLESVQNIPSYFYTSIIINKGIFHLRFVNEIDANSFRSAQVSYGLRNPKRTTLRYYFVIP